jgi:hypothetical protein
VIGLVMLVRRLQGKAVFTERDWLLLFGHPAGLFGRLSISLLGLLVRVGLLLFIRDSEVENAI